MTDKITCSHQRRDQDNLARFVEAYAETGQLDLACKAIGITTTTYSRWRLASRADKTDPRFLIEDPLGELPPVAFVDAVDEAWKTFLETKAVSRLAQLATGIRKEIIHQGRKCFEPDTTKPEMLDPISGLLHFPAKRDEAGVPIVMTIEEVREGSLQFLLKSRHPDFKEKSEIDLTQAGGKPLFFPASCTDLDALMKEQGSEYIDVKKPTAD